MCLSVQVIKEQVTRELQISKGGTKYVNTGIRKHFVNFRGSFITQSFKKGFLMFWAF